MEATMMEPRMGGMSGMGMAGGAMGGLMIPRCTMAMEKCEGGMRMTCQSSDATAIAMMHNLGMMMMGGMTSVCMMMNGMMVMNCNMTMGMCKCEMTDDGMCMSCTSGDPACCAMIQACCDCMMAMMGAGCSCCLCMNNMPVCCG